VNLVTLTVAWFVGLFLMWRVRTVPKQEPAGADHGPPRVSVVIPARNEAHNLPRLLASLSQQALAPHEVLVVDDDSSDDTAAVARSLGATVIGSGGPADGWMGKGWACWLGAQAATGDLLLFLDADAWLEPEAVADLARLQQHRGGLVTVQPYHVTVRAYEQLSAFFNIVLMAGLNAFTPLGERVQPGGGFGPCVMCRRQDYFRVGGHAASRCAMLEDLALAQAFAEHGLPVGSFGGRGTVSFRMYPDGLRSLLEGWTKNFGQGAACLSPVMLLLSVAWVCGCFGAAFDPLLRHAWLDAGLLVAYGLIYSAYAAQVWWMLRRIGRFRVATAVLFPVPLLAFGLVMAVSLFLKVVVGRAVWKGRVVPIGGRG